MILGLIVIFLILIIIDIPYILKKKSANRILIVYSLLMIVGFTMSLLQIIDKIPKSPVVLIEKIVTAIIY
ncbi:hypothetical protein GOQ27_12725 [Clostridium sp. D2Q-11]|uniref:Uncharacterized protein n=1 Tax=Anaeromonas frigoriresistens TaxID=2683708 RepID=A0A942Z823_9FIRM|nr:hypothetical protein [Anaeromonas frigoriresistens]MBS4539332.1 hypothetical protein [Anaeromonas frigoriresistens]